MPDGKTERYWPVRAGRTVSVILPSFSYSYCKTASNEVSHRFHRAAYLIYWLGTITHMTRTVNDREGNREELKAKRNLLFKLFLKNPMHTRLAVEIKVLDDQLTECNRPGVLVQK